MKKLIIFLFLFIITQKAFSSETLLEQCSTKNGNSFEIQLRKISKNKIREAHRNFDYEIIVRETWSDFKVTDTIQETAKNASDQFDMDGFLKIKRWCTKWSKKCFEDAIEEIGNKTFTSFKFEKAFENVAYSSSESIFNYFGKKISETTSEVDICLKKYLSNSYPDIIKTAFEDETRRNLGSTKDYKNFIEDYGIDINTISIGTGTAFVAFSLVRKQLTQKISGQLSRRVIGKLATNSIPYVGWVILTLEGGFFLISRDSQINKITEALSGPELNKNLQNSVSYDLKTMIAREIDPIANKISNEILNNWKSFQKNNEKILFYINDSPRFKEFVSLCQDLECFQNIGDALNQILKVEGSEVNLGDFINKNYFNKVMEFTPMHIKFYNETGSIKNVIDWQKVVSKDNELDKILEFEIYQYKDPNVLNQKQVEYILSFDDRDNILNLIRNISQRNLNNLSKLPYLQSRKLFISLRTDDEISEFFKHFNNIEEITVKDIFYKYISSSNFKPTEIIDILKIVDSSKNTEFMANTLTSRNIFTPFTLLFKGHLSFNIFKFFLLNYIIFVILILWLFKKRKNVFEFFFKFNRYIYKKSPQSSKSNIK